MRENFGEDFYFASKPGWLLELFKKIDDFCLNNIKRGVRREFRKTYIRWEFSGIMFCRMFVYKNSLKIYLRLKYSELGENVPVFIRDYSEKVRGIPTIEILLDKEYLQNEQAFSVTVFSLIEKAFSEVVGAEKLKPVKREVAESVKPREIIRPSSINISVDDNGYMSINLKLHKSQKDLLNRILQETILK